MGTRRRTYNVLPPATTEWELHLSRSLGDSTSRGFRDLTDFVCRIVERATIRARRSRSPPLHRSRSAVGRSTHDRTSSSNRRGRSRTPPRGRLGRRTSPKRMVLWNSSPLISPVRSLSPPRVVREVTPAVRRAPGRKSPGTAATRISPTKEKQATPREKLSPEKEKPARRLTPEKQLNPTRRFTTVTSTTSGAGPSAPQVQKKSTPRAIVRPSTKALRDSIKANRDECKRLAKELQESVDRRERAQAAKTEKPRKKFPKSKATVSSSSSSSRSVGTSRASSAGSVQLANDMSPAGSTLTIPFTPDGTTQTTKKASVAANRKRTDRVRRYASDNLQ